jgi:4-amino-4-deoxy-L-arabinose transferase-like glycosyltransferase
MLVQSLTDKNWPEIDKKVELYVLPAVLTVLFLLPHLPFLNNGYVDLEKYCVQAGLEIARNGFNANLTDYFSTVFNPVFSVLLLAGSYKIFGESPVISRLTVSILALAFSLFLYYYLRKKKGATFAFITTLLVVVNPMFIVYSQYVYSDVPFMVFVSIALLLLLFNASRKENVTSSVMLGVSLATKYVAAPFFIVGFIFSLVKSKIMEIFSKSKLLSFVWFNIWYFGLALLLSIPIILLVFHYQTSIFPSDSESMLSLGVTMYIPRLFACLLWLGLFIGPFCIIFLFDLWLKAGVKKFLLLLTGAALLTLAVSYFYPVSSLHVQAEVFGEMNLGWVESKVPSWALSVAFFLIILMAELFIAGLAFDLKRYGIEKTRELFIWILLPILLFSFTRVANRYLLSLLVPLSLYMTQVSGRIYFEKKSRLAPVVLTLHALIFLAVGFYSNYYLHQRGLA